MHPFKQHILKELTTSEKRRFSQLKPKAIESNLFVYHLKSLVSEGYVKKLEESYQLTALGKRYVDKLSLRNFQPRFQPKIVTVIICKNSKEEYLLCHSSRQPFFGKLCFPYGKIHFGETLKAGAARELKEKTGLSAQITHRADAYLTVYENEELVTHMLCHIFLVAHCKGELKPHSSHPGEFCASWQKITKENRANFIPGFLNFFELVKTNKALFFKELTLKI